MGENVMIEERVNVLLERGDIDEAERAVLAYLREYEDDVNAYVALMNVYIEKEAYSQAIVAGIDAYHLDPNNVPTLETLGWLYLKDGDTRLAKEQFEKAERLYPESPFILGNLGIIATIDKDYARAKTYFEKALAFNKDDATAWVNLGVVRAETGDDEGALAAFEKAKALRSKDERVSSYITKIAKRKEAWDFSHGPLIPLPQQPRLFHVDVPEDWNASVNEGVIEIASPDKRFILLISYGVEIVDKKTMTAEVEKYKSGKRIREVVTPMVYREKQGEKIASLSFVEAREKGELFEAIAMHEYKGKTLFATFTSNYRYSKKLSAFAMRVMSSLSLRAAEEEE